MSQSLSITALIAGVIFIILGLTGGGFKIFGAEIASSISNKYLRFIATAFGIIFLIISFPQVLSEQQVTEPFRTSNQTSASINNLFDKTTITNSILEPVDFTAQGIPVVATENGNGAKLSVRVNNLSGDINKNDYKLVSFARVNGSSNWDYQGSKILSESPSPFELTLWHDPEANAGNQKLYEVITIISSTLSSSAPKTFTEDDVERFQITRSETLVFYRDDSRRSIPQ
ncbi:hypothetical protein [Pseudanabaena sp. FACHB-2040]|uniref:hypothetical protein n=1 Tax=Pseudanabaena sp. FACHB-2040 TaxID=2692859 RepID=UPI001684426B|nr:hypothetical protein [Pseudanabaena sp. FACHB-2040]MBD2256780.1 hypothetical protein [Pseudanabaena sp. FACHB-2040]